MFKKINYFLSSLILLLILLPFLNSNLNDNIIHSAIKKDSVNEEIPSQYISLYQKAAQKYGVSWFFLASIHNQETTFSSNVSISSAGAIGHGQFMRCTWVGWSYSGCKGTKGDSKAVNDTVLKDPAIIKKHGGYGVDANLDGKADPFDIVDGIYSTANYLSSALRNTKASDSRSRVKAAAMVYNKSEKYANEVANRYERYAKEWQGTSPDNSLLLTGVTNEDMWLEGSYSGIDGVLSGTPVGEATSSTGKVVNNGDEILYISPFEVRVIDPDNFHNVGIKNKGKKTSVFIEYLLTDVSKFLANVFYVITLILGILLFGYMSLIWLMILLARRGMFFLDDYLEKISMGNISANDNLKKVISSTILSFFLLGFSISGYISDLFILIYSSIILMIDKI